MTPLLMSSTDASVPAVSGDPATSPLQPYRSAGDGQRWWNLPSRTVAPRLAVVGASLLALGVVLALCEARWGATITSWDRPINEWFVRLGGGEGGIVHTLSTAVSWIGSGRRTGPIVLVFAAVLVVLRNWRWAVFVLLSAEVGYLISDVTKVLVARQRPPYLTFDALAVTTSFPSGHTFGGITAWVAMGLTMWFLLPRPWSTVVGITLMSIGVLNGPSRLLLGAHWVSDVIGSWLLASGWCLLAAAFTLWRWGPRPIEVDTA
jgi:undecaprenyl-diphosphatase